MSCCGQKRSALSQPRPAAPATRRRRPSALKASKLTSIPGHLGGARASAAMLAFLARKARSGQSQGAVQQARRASGRR
jgi:hypothetical protein